MGGNSDCKRSPFFITVNKWLLIRGLICMNMKKIVPLACTLLIGGGLGYVVGIKQSPSSDSEKTAKATTERKVARFGDSSKSSNGNKDGDATIRVSGRETVDSLLLKYSRMNAAQIEDEIKNLNDVNLLRGEPDMKKMMALVYLSYKWGQTSPQRALKESEKLGMVGMLTVPLILNGWAETNPEGAAAYYMENRKKVPHGDWSLKNIATELGKSSPSEAMRWVESLTEKDRKSALPAILGGIADSHPEQLSANIGKLSEDDLKNSALCANIAGKWASTDWEATSKWIDSLGEKQQKEARKTALAQLGLTDIDKATQEYSRLNESEQSGVARDITRNLASKGGPEALEWLVKNTSEKIAEENVRSAIGFGSSPSQLEETHDYVMNMPDGKIKDSSLQEIIQKNSYGVFSGGEVDYVANLDMATNIKDEKKRGETVDNVVSSWARNDPEKAKEWIQSSNLSEEKKQEQLKKCEETIKWKAEANS